MDFKGVEVNREKVVSVAKHNGEMNDRAWQKGRYERTCICMFRNKKKKYATFN